jgi:hypothetical protein
MPLLRQFRYNAWIAATFSFAPFGERQRHADRADDEQPLCGYSACSLMQRTVVCLIGWPLMRNGGCLGLLVLPQPDQPVSPQLSWQLFRPAIAPRAPPLSLSCSAAEPGTKPDPLLALLLPVHLARTIIVRQHPHKRRRQPMQSHRRKTEPPQTSVVCALVAEPVSSLISASRHGWCCSQQSTTEHK